MTKHGSQFSLGQCALMQSRDQNGVSQKSSFRLEEDHAMNARNATDNPAT